MKTITEKKEDYKLEALQLIEAVSKKVCKKGKCKKGMGPDGKPINKEDCEGATPKTDKKIDKSTDPRPGANPEKDPKSGMPFTDKTKKKKTKKAKLRKVKADMMPEGETEMEVEMDCCGEDCEGCCCCEDYVTEEDFQLVLQAVGQILDQIYSTSMRRMDNIVDKVNQYIEDHAESHLPELEKNQVVAILNAAGIANQFEDEKEPITPEAERIWASIPQAQAAKLGLLKFDVK